MLCTSQDKVGGDNAERLEGVPDEFGALGGLTLDGTGDHIGTNLGGFQNGGEGTIVGHQIAADTGIIHGQKDLLAVRQDNIHFGADDNTFQSSQFTHGVLRMVRVVKHPKEKGKKMVIIIVIIITDLATKPTSWPS